MEDVDRGEEASHREGTGGPVGGILGQQSNDQLIELRWQIGHERCHPRRDGPPLHFEDLRQL